MIGLVLNFVVRAGERIERFIISIGTVIGVLLGAVVFAVRLFDPKGMNVPLMKFNRWAVVAVATVALIALIWRGGCALLRRQGRCWICGYVLSLTGLLVLSLMYLMPQVFQYTQEFVYFGEIGVSTMALLRGIGFCLGLIVCSFLSLSVLRVSQALGYRGSLLVLNCSLLFFFLEYSVKAVAALQRLKIIGLSDFVFEIMIFGDNFSNVFLFAQLLLGGILLSYVVVTHWSVQGEFPNKARRRKEKARLRGFRRWSYSLLTWSVITVVIVVVLHYFDTKPPAEIQPEGYEIQEGIITINLDQVADGHLHKFSYVTPAGYDVRFLVVKKPVGTAYGVGLDACEICGIAGYFERGEEDVVCRRCDVVMNKNTIGFKGGCNPIPFAYEVKDSKIYIDVRELERHEKRFK
ncbi:MAG: hypothetical protein CSA35_09085 [Dethiosulfovibrio peptidovorans]|nr:MAG: hypothetical protein CSA35_09085 [Dethiosulfovibrio peptidovorans]